MKEYIKVFWLHTSEQEAKEAAVILYEVDLNKDRYATRMIAVYSDGHTENIEDEAWGFVTESPVCTTEEINAGEYGEEIQACAVTEVDFNEIWHTRRYSNSIYFSQE